MSPLARFLHNFLTINIRKCQFFLKKSGWFCRLWNDGCAECTKTKSCYCTGIPYFWCKREHRRTTNGLNRALSCQNPLRLSINFHQHHRQSSKSLLMTQAALTMKQWEPISKWKEDTIEIGHKCCWLAKLLQSKVYRRRDNHVYFFRYATILYIKYTQLLSSFKSSYRIGWQPSGLRVNRKLVIGWDDRVLNFCAFVLIFGHHTKDSSTCNGEKQYVIRYFGNTLFKVDEMFMVLLQVIGWSRDITARRRGEYY